MVNHQISFHNGSYMRKGKHKTGCDFEWEKEFMWLEYSIEHDMKHNMTACNQSGVWVSQPCLHMRKVIRHSQSDMYLAALERE